MQLLFTSHTTMADMNTQHLQRLQDEQKKVINNCEEKIKKCEKYIDDYKILKTQLDTLPDKLHHDILVPFGPLAFMPGKMIHTNEVLVLLGDNWFVERSVKQAAEIVQRRINSTDAMLKNIHKEKTKISSHFDFTEDLNKMMQDEDVVEIVEEYDEDREHQWRQNRRSKFKMKKQQHTTPQEPNPGYNDQEITEDCKQINNNNNMGSISNEQESSLLSRLDEIDRLEEKEDELNRYSLREKHVTWKDFDSDVNYNNDDENFTHIKPKTSSKYISFHHTCTDSAVHELTDSSSSSSTSSSPRTPGDIYKLNQLMRSGEIDEKISGHHSIGAPKSILKITTKINTERRISVEEEVSDEDKSPEVFEQKVNAFSGFVVERQQQCTNNSLQSNSTTSSVFVNQKPKKISRFKAKRQTDVE